MPGRGLNRRQLVFVDKLVSDPTLTPTEAARQAGYSEEAAHVQASRLLANANVRAAIDAGVEAASRRLGARADVVLRGLLRIATCDIAKAFDVNGHLLPIHDIPEDVRQAIAGIEVEELWEGRGESRERVGTLHKVKFWDKPGALRDLGRHLGLFRDKVEVTGKVGVEQLVAEAVQAERNVLVESIEDEDEDDVEDAEVDE